MRLARLVSVTAVATAACALWALPASAATASPLVRHATTTRVTATPGRAFVGAAVKLSAIVRSRVGTPAGSVRFTWNGRKLCTATLHRGSGFCFTRFSRARTYLVVGTYPGNSRFLASSGTARVQIVPPHPTTTTVMATPSNASVGAAVQLSATVTSSGSTPTGVVTFKSGSATLCSAHLSRGAASCAASFGSVGTVAVTGTYGGDAAHARSSGHASVTVTPASTTTTITNPSPGSVLAGLPFTVNVTVTSAFGTPTGTVMVAPTSPTGLPAPYSCTATLTAGKGSCQVTPLAGSFGDIFYEATYSGDATHTTSVSTGMHELIVPETTTTSVTPATAAHGPVTLTATVIGQAMTNISPSAGGTGTVTFTITQNSMTVATCSSEPLTYAGGGANNATCQIPSLAAGTYTVTAAYSGDPNNLKSMGMETLTVT